MKQTITFLAFAAAPDQRRFWRGLLVALLAALALAPTASGPVARTARAQESPPNVLLIITDDQRWDTLYGMPMTRWWFGRYGIRFTRAHVTTPLCCPSRASIFSGRYAHNHGVFNNRDASAYDHESTLQRYLKDAGYRTALVGKFLNAWPLEQAPPFFDRYFMFQGGYVAGTYNDNGGLRRIERYTTTFLGSKASEYLNDFESTDNTPWYMVVAPWAPHADPVAEPAYREAPVSTWRRGPGVGEKDRTDKPPEVQQHRREAPWMARSLRRKQIRTLYSVDDVVDGLLQQLGDLSERDNTIVVFMSDNGLLWSEHGLIGKGFPYVEAARIPMLLMWGDRLSPQVDHRLVANIDIAPTVLDAVGIEPDPRFPIDGRSLFDRQARDHLLIEGLVAGRKYASFLSRSLQYTEYYDDVTGDITFQEYYDLVADPGELDNLIAATGERRGPSWTEIAARLRQDSLCSGATCP